MPATDVSFDHPDVADAGPVAAVEVPLPQARLVLKLKNHLEQEQTPPAVVRGMLPGNENELIGVVVTLLFDLSEDRIGLLHSRARGRDAHYLPAARGQDVPPPLLEFLALDAPTAAQAERLGQLLSRSQGVDLAYIEAGTSFPSAGLQSDVIAALDQGYLAPSREGGVDALYAHRFDGGDGAGVRFMDVETGWFLDHADLADAGVIVASGIPDPNSTSHGTGVLGIVAATTNGTPVVGITPAASTSVVSTRRSEKVDSTADAILAALPGLRFGDVLLIEVEVSSGNGGRPIEVEDAVFEAIRLATALGVVVVEPAGNGGADLDQFTLRNRKVLNRQSSDYRDSGAIVVGGAQKANPHAPIGFNCGSRVDCYSWGEEIATIKGETLFSAHFGRPERLWAGRYLAVKDFAAVAALDPPPSLSVQVNKVFDGTSGASAIIAGVAVAVQGLAFEHFGFRYSPWQLRLLLSDPDNGTPSNDPANDRIGVMPDLRKIIDNVLRISSAADLDEGIDKTLTAPSTTDPSRLAPAGVERPADQPYVYLLPFAAKGDPSALRTVRFEVISRLPRQASLWLEMPRGVADLEGIWAGPQVPRFDPDNIYIPVNPNGKHYFRYFDLAAGGEVKLRLVAKFPTWRRKQRYQVAVRLLQRDTARQVDEEVARATWPIEVQPYNSRRSRKSASAGLPA
jgi:subtilase family protein